MNFIFGNRSDACNASVRTIVWRSGDLEGLDGCGVVRTQESYLGEHSYALVGGALPDYLLVCKYVILSYC